MERTRLVINQKIIKTRENLRTYIVKLKMEFFGHLNHKEKSPNDLRKKKIAKRELYQKETKLHNFQNQTEYMKDSTL